MVLAIHSYIENNEQNGALFSGIKTYKQIDGWIGFKRKMAQYCIMSISHDLDSRKGPTKHWKTIPIFPIRNGMYIMGFPWENQKSPSTNPDVLAINSIYT
jgi:hypothetical protein